MGYRNGIWKAADDTAVWTKEEHLDGGDQPRIVEFKDTNALNHYSMFVC